MSEFRPAEAVVRPTKCPSCDGKIVGTLAKVISMTSVWRCRECEHTWTLASLAVGSRHSR
jgi:ribosomal protein L37AE/L43A